MKLVPETTYKVVNDDGSEVHSATAQKVNDIVQLMKDAKILGNSSPVGNNVALRVASAILNTYELRIKRQTKKQPIEEPKTDVDPNASIPDYTIPEMYPSSEFNAANRNVCDECGNRLNDDNKGHEPDCNQNSLGQ